MPDPRPQLPEIYTRLWSKASFKMKKVKIRKRSLSLTLSKDALVKSIPTPIISNREVSIEVEEEEKRPKSNIKHIPRVPSKKKKQRHKSMP